MCIRDRVEGVGGLMNANVTDYGTGKKMTAKGIRVEMDKLCVVDHYPSDRFTFSSNGYDPVSYTHLTRYQSLLREPLQ